MILDSRFWILDCKRAHNPRWKEAGLTKPRAAQGPVAGGGDLYGWHAPDGLRPRAATGLGCMQASAEKLGVVGRAVGQSKRANSNCRDGGERVGAECSALLRKAFAGRTIRNEVPGASW